MSVHYFHPKTITAILAACWDNGSAASADGKRMLERYAEIGRTIHEANVKAWNMTYSDQLAVEPITAADVKAALISRTVMPFDKLIFDLSSLEYNCVANNGYDFATPEVLRGILRLYKGAATLRALA